MDGFFLSRSPNIETVGPHLELREVILAQTLNSRPLTYETHYPQGDMC